MKLIDKAALVAEIEKRIKETESMQPKFDQFWAGQISAFKGVLKILDTLEVKEFLTWQDVRLIAEIGESFMNSEESDHLSEEEYYTEILNRFKAQKGEEV